MKRSKTLSNWSNREHMKMFAMGLVLIRFVKWHNEESRGHNMKQIKGKLLQYSNRSICYFGLLGLGRRPVIATGDKKPAFVVIDDDYSKQFNRELLNYYHSKGNIKMFNDVNFSCSFSNDSQTCMPWKAYKWAIIFLKIIPLSFTGQRAVVNWCCLF